MKAGHKRTAHWGSRTKAEKWIRYGELSQEAERHGWAKTYKERLELLRSLGFKSYAAYLKSSLWKGIAKRVMARDHRRCVLCDEPAIVVHHAHYTKHNLDGTYISHLYALCQKCHVQLEFHPGRRKRRLLEVGYLTDTKLRARKAYRELFCDLTDEQFREMDKKKRAEARRARDTTRGAKRRRKQRRRKKLSKSICGIYGLGLWKDQPN